MERIWYIQVNGGQEGPYSVEQLKVDARVTPDTLVWRHGYKVWVPARDVPELQEIFKDEREIDNKDADEDGSTPLPQDELVLDWRGGQMDPNFLYALLILALLLLSYIIYELYT